MIRRMRARRGFTLIELLVVLVILALLAGIVLPRFLDQTKKAQVAAAKSQISSFKSAIQLYAVDNGQPPTTQQGLDALVHQPSGSPQPRNWKKYLTDVNEIPKDPWGNPYDYQSPGPNGEDFVIISYGMDGKPGPGNSEYDKEISSTDSCNGK